MNYEVRCTCKVLGKRKIKKYDNQGGQLKKNLKKSKWAIMVLEQVDKWERNSDKGTISEDDGHGKWTGVGKLIVPRGPRREKKTD